VDYKITDNPKVNISTKSLIILPGNKIMTENQTELQVQQQEQELNLNDILKILVRRRRVFTLAVAIIFCLGTLYLFISKNIYESNVKLVINVQNTRGSSLTGFSALDPFSSLGATRSLETQMEIIKSRPIIDAVIKKFGIKNKKGLYLDPTIYLKKFVKVETVKDTDIINIIVNDETPENAKKIANEIAKIYIEQDTKNNAEAARISRSFIEDQLVSLKKELAKAEEDIKKFKEKNRTVAIQAEAEEAIKRTSGLQADLAKAQAQLMETTSKLGEIEAQLKKQNPNFESQVTFTDNPAIEEMKKNLIRLEVERSKLIQEYNDKHPDVQAINAQIKRAKKDMAKEMKLIVGSRVTSANPIYQKLFNDYVEAQGAVYGLNSTISALKGLVEKEKSVMATLPAKEQELARLLRIKAAHEKTYVQLLEKYQEFKIAEASNLSSARIIEPAVTPEKHVKPQRIKGIILSMFLGIIAGFCVAFLAEYIDDTIKTKEDIENIHNLKVLGVIPQLKQDEIDTLFTDNEKNSFAAEAFRNIRSNIKFFSYEKDMHAILVTSSTPGDGKTFIALQIAKVIAKAGTKVILIGADLRNPSHHELFNLPFNKGLSTYLSGETKDPKDIIVKTEIENLYLIPAGPVPPNPAELLQSTRMINLLTEIKSNYDFVIVDTPPTPILSDALAIACEMDGVIVTASYGHTKRSALRDTFESLRMTGTNLLGTVLNNFQIKKERYGGYGYGYGYGGYGYGGKYGYGYGYGNRYGRKPHKKEESKKDDDEKLNKLKDSD
jgi:polysaccharide chain length determinant protein (PEP-CTERM system associated)